MRSSRDRSSPPRSPGIGGLDFAYHDRNDIHDPILDRYVPQLRQRLGDVR